MEDEQMNMSGTRMCDVAVDTKNSNESILIEKDGDKKSRRGHYT
jgi:hypothetical protein